MSLYYDEKNGMYYTIKPDEWAESPRETTSYDSTMITFERNYQSPDRNPFNEWDDMLKHFGVKRNEHEDRSIYSDLEQLSEKALKKGYVIMPIWKYDHTGIEYRAAERYPFHDSRGNGFGWDGGIVGVIYEKRNRRNVDVVKEQLKAEVSEYSQYANGEVYEVTAYDKNGEIIDSVGDMYDNNRSYEKIVIAAVNEFTNNDYLLTDTNQLEEVHYEHDYMPVDIDPDLVDDEYEYEDMEYRSLTIEERIEAHQEYIKEYRQEPSLADQIKDAGSEKVVPETVDTKSKDLEI